MANILLSALLSITLTFLFSYNVQFLNMHEEYREIGYLNHLYENLNMTFGLLIGLFMGLFFAITPIVLQLPSIIKNKLTQLHMSNVPIKTHGRIVDLVVDSDNTTRIKVGYSGTEKTFSFNSELLSDKFHQGDEIVVFYDEKDKNKAYLDLFHNNHIDKFEEEYQKEEKTLFKLIDISPSREIGLDYYEVTGEIFGSEYNGKRAKFAHKFENRDLHALIPGRVIPCTILGTGDDLSISLILK